MGLWVARRHKVPVSQALANFEKACRSWQNPDGTFPYSPQTRKLKGMPSTPCLTCAGLLGLAYCHGAVNEAALLKYAKSGNGPKPAPGKGLRDPANDPALRKGLSALETFMKADKRWAPAQKGAKGSPLDDDADPTFAYMSLWSIERVGEVYDREKIGKVDWYNWGARILLDQQEKDGSWPAEWLHSPKIVNNAFALLFLKRSNPAPDLTVTLKGTLPQPRESSSPSEAAPAKQEPIPEPSIKLTLPKSKPEK